MSPSGGRLEGEAEDSRRSTSSEGSGVIDTVATRECGHDEREELVSRIRSADRRAEVEMALDQTFQTEVVGQSGWQQETRVGHQTIVVKGRVEASRLCDDRIYQVLLLLGAMGDLNAIFPSSEGHLIRRFSTSQAEAVGGSGVRNPPTPPGA